MRFLMCILCYVRVLCVVSRLLSPLYFLTGSSLFSGILTETTKNRAITISRERFPGPEPTAELVGVLKSPSHRVVLRSTRVHTSVMVPPRFHKNVF